MTDKAIDEIVERMAYCIGEAKDERRDDTSQIFDEMKQALQTEIQKQVTLGRLDEIQKLSDDTADLLPNETWKSWAFRVSDYLQKRYAALQAELGGKT